MRLTVPSTETTEASRLAGDLVEVDRRTSTRSAVTVLNGAGVGYGKRTAGSGVNLVGTASAAVQSVSVPVQPGRRYRVDVDLSAAADGSGATGLETRLAWAAGGDAVIGSSVLRYFPFVLPGGTVWDHLSGFAVFDVAVDSTSGSVGLLLWVQGTTAGRNYTVIGNATAEAHLLVTDIGVTPQT
jgi:hypothetical protein